MADSTTLDRYLRDRAAALRAADRPPANRAAWQARRVALRQAMAAALGPAPEKPGELAPRLVGTLRRPGYRIEKLLVQARPDGWVTASAYVPEPLSGKVPAVLVVHGHWAGARRDPVVQARCLGLVKLGFFVLAVDAFGAGERHPAYVRGSYHGALQGSTLWPTGLTLLGVQVQDNHRMVDYLQSRPEVDGARIGITGASGGGNQTMYAGALDDRLAAVVPVCSVGSYQAYLKAACCVCEVLPGALRFTEEGEVLGLVAPRALLVVSATRDAFQFSVGEAKKSLAMARAIYQLHGKEEALGHAIFESGHDYSQAMREAMYGWMTRWLKGEGDGKPIAEPKHEVEAPEDLACYADGKRPAGYLFPAELAGREGRRLLAWQDTYRFDHAQAWEAQAATLRTRLEAVLGGLPAPTRAAAKRNAGVEAGGIRTTTLQVSVEPGLDLDVVVRHKPVEGKQPLAVLLHLDGKDAALKHPLAAALLTRGWAVWAPDLRGTGAGQPAGDAIAGAPDHNSAEHAVWVGRPLLGGWVADVRAVLATATALPGMDAGRVALIGLGQAGVVAVTAAALAGERLASVAAVDSLASYVTAEPFAAGTRMGLLVPGLLTAGDVPHLAALRAPGKLLIVGGFTAAGKRLDARGLADAYAFTRKVYTLTRSDAALTLRPTLDPGALVELL